ncbi:hypothetical protein TPHA_0I01270 [Tetrapisispora phaffii CBS 4417]|uniref:PH domain-containing protein n=1 Tax=Tetrapisispora phaffii (strain ATCC 24235 / CBS 4417 / NBRC 1672 / NRRL Y-8282 / UCD 70-5) TaxID=1071381 RepID=G8BXK5_TETPH|nr:hypothetical protein TPHA_0I01270 [Tetrapisispora phaffii CBS 4417]CCE64633.1 hypothetical protein TPHA_0I01270 [Tetrapisispora phaffii CBS 4417]
MARARIDCTGDAPAMEPDVLRSLGSDHSIASSFDVAPDSLVSNSNTTLYSDHNILNELALKNLQCYNANFDKIDNEFIYLIDPVPVHTPDYTSVFPYQVSKLSQNPIYERVVKNESLPPYKHTIYKYTVVSVKQEFATPYEPSLNRNWVNLIVELNSTQLNFYSIEESLTSSIKSYSSNVFETNDFRLNSNAKFHNFFKKTKTYMLDDVETKKILKKIKKNPSKYLNNSNMVTSFSLQFGKVGIPKDYKKRSHALRLRLETQQFLIKFPTIDDLIYWANYIHMGICISLDLDLRELPKYKFIPRRRRRRRDVISDEPHERNERRPQISGYIRSSSGSALFMSNPNRDNYLSEHLNLLHSTPISDKSHSPLISQSLKSPTGLNDGRSNSLSIKIKNIFKSNKSRPSSTSNTPSNSRSSTPVSLSRKEHFQNTRTRTTRSTSLPSSIRSPALTTKKSLSSIKVNIKQDRIENSSTCTIHAPAARHNTNMNSLLNSDSFNNERSSKNEVNSFIDKPIDLIAFGEESPTTEQNISPNSMERRTLDPNLTIQNEKCKHSISLHQMDYLDVIGEYNNEDDEYEEGEEIYSDGDYAEDEIMSRSNSTNRLSIYDVEGFFHESDDDDDYDFHFNGVTNSQTRTTSMNETNQTPTSVPVNHQPSITIYDYHDEIKWYPPSKQMTRKRFIKHSLRCLKTLNEKKAWVGKICIQPQNIKSSDGIKPIYIGDPKNNSKSLNGYHIDSPTRNHPVKASIIGPVGFIHFSEKYTLLDKMESKHIE